ARPASSELKIIRNGLTKTLVVTLAAERIAQHTIGYVVTFDDMTDLLSAQRKAAWADVARRIAHEIKNPLTPIQLSAERLQRKYEKEITSDPETFATCTQTIIRHVEDIGRMVDEFSAFARMPELVMENENLSELCRQSVFIERNRDDQITFELNLPQDDVIQKMDGRQIGRALTNILKNASESLITDGDKAAPEAKGGWIRLSLETMENRNVITVEDNGRGLPVEIRDRLTEPYVTTRDKGTGLGLAIVKKIMEDHGGELILEDRPGGGVIVSLILPFGETMDEDDMPDHHTNDDPMTTAAKTMIHDT
ncbi:MAG: ATP-binding protein, partial [Rhodospirillales bacterium]|nr:ATP-binding protein [Rhodospirillales bacterium]MCW8971626.1 ATP-binding protein [Rhodospirillales bacterium]